MKLVSDWRQAWRWFSIQIFVLAGALPLVWAQLPPDAKAMLPETWEPWVLAALAVAGIVGRVIDQGDAK